MMTDRLSDMTAGTTLLPDLTRQPTVSGTYLRAIVDFAVLRGIGRRALLHDVGLTELDLADDRRHPLDVLMQLLRAAAVRSDDPAFALHFGQHVPCEQVSLAAPLGKSATNVVEALQQVNRYAPLSTDFPTLRGGDRFRLERDHAGVWLRDMRPRDDRAALTELVFSRMVLGIRRVQQHDVVRAVYVTHAAPSYIAAYDKAFGVPVHFGSARNALLLDPRWLDTELVPAPAHVTRILATHAERQLSELTAQRTCRGRLEAALRPLLHTGDTSVSRMASELAMSRQTLYRRLKAEGVTFEEVLESVRRDVAIDALRDGSMPVRVVAQRVGFSDAAAFSRAFKRWTGERPGRVSRAE